MTHKKVFTVKFRREREKKTNYHTRLSLLKSNTPRLVVRKSNRNMAVQLIQYSDKGDKVIAHAHPSELKKFGWKYNTGSISSAYLLGLLIGVRAKGKSAILDLGLQSPIKGSRLFAVLQGAVEGGLKMNVSEEIFPAKGRIEGKHIAEYAKMIKSNKEKYSKVFSAYLKDKLDPEKMPEQFELSKKQILS